MNALKKSYKYLNKLISRRIEEMWVSSGYIL